MCFFLNKFMKTSYASPVQWRFMIASHLDERNSRISSRWGSSCFDWMASLGVRPYCHTRKHQWALFRPCVNLLVNLSSDEGDTNENITWKYQIILFVLLFGITLSHLTPTEMADYPVTKLVGVTLKLRKLNEKLSNGRSNPEVVGSIPPEVKRTYSLPRVVPWFPLLGLTPSGSFMGFS